MPLISFRTRCCVKHTLGFAILSGVLLPYALFAQTSAPTAPERPVTAPIPVSPADTPPASGSLPDVHRKIPMQSLAAAFAEARLSRPVLVMAVGRESAAIPQDKTLSLEKALPVFGLDTRQFGWILAAGPPRITHLETHLGEPDPFSDMPPDQAMPLLMASLTDAQRGKLTGRNGLGLSDLTNPTQEKIFRALMPRNSVGGTGQDDRDGLRSLLLPADREAAAQGAKIHLGQELQMLPHTGDNERILAPRSRKADDRPVYDLDSGSAYQGGDTLKSIPVRYETPNTFRGGQLDFDDPRLQIAVAPDGLATVSDLMARIASETKLEIYADAHYDERTLLLRTGRKSARAADFLRALAFCVGGTYRRLGPAYVLTDDVVGVGTRRQIIENFQKETDALRFKILRAAEKSLRENPAVQNTTLDWLDKNAALTPEQEKSGKPLKNQDLGLSAFSLPFDRLTDAQQTSLRDFAARQAQERKKNPNDTIRVPDLTQEVTMLRQPVVTLTFPGMDGTMRLDIGRGLTSLLKKTTDYDNDDVEALQRMLYGEDGTKYWNQARDTVSRRGLLCRARSRDEVDRALRRLREFHLTELWFVVFEEGKVIIPGTPFPIIPALRDAPDLLTYAAEAAKKQNVKVCPVMELFAWGSDTPKELRDVTLIGEDSEQAEARRYRIRVAKTKAGRRIPDPPKRMVYVNPLLGTVQKKLRGLMAAVAAHPGLSDWVWNEAVPPGYAHSSDYVHRREYSVGYTESLRLAMLRKYHSDPVDIKPVSDSRAFDRVDLSLKNYDSDPDEEDYSEAWHDVCEEALRGVLHTLYTDSLAGLPRSGRPNVLVMQGDKAENVIWYDIWQPDMKEAPHLTEDARQEPVEANAADSGGSPKAAAAPTNGIFHLFLPDHVGPLTVEHKDWPSLLGLQWIEIARFRGGKWGGIVLEEQDINLDN